MCLRARFDLFHSCTWLEIYAACLQAKDYLYDDATAADDDEDILTLQIQPSRTL